MGIKVSSITKYLLLLIIIMRFSFLKLAGNFLPIFSTSGDNYQMVMLYLILVFFTMLSVAKTYRTVSKDIRRQVLLALFAVFAGMIISLMSGETILIECLALSINYIYIILAIPMAVLLVNGKWNIRKFLVELVVLCAAAYAIRFYIAAVYSRTGMVIYPNIAEEAAKTGWFRNERLRVNPPFLANVFIPMTYYLSKTTRKRMRKLFYWGLMLLSVGYSYSVHQARSTFMYQIIVLLLTFAFDRMSDKKKLLGLVLASLVTIVFVNSSIFDGWISSFDSNTITGQSALSRLTTIAYFGPQYLRNPIFGLGVLSSKNHNVAGGLGHLTDIGMLQSVFLLGLPIVFFLIATFRRGIRVMMRAKKLNNDKFILIFGMTLLILITGINIDCFSSIFCLSMPIYLALVEYVDNENRTLLL